MKLNGLLFNHLPGCPLPPLHDCAQPCTTNSRKTHALSANNCDLQWEADRKTLTLRGFCPSCGARRMADSAALLVDEILPYKPMRQWVLSVPFPLRFLFASQPAVMGKVLGIVYRAIATHLIHKAGFAKPMAQSGAVTLIQRFGSALNLNIHFHMLFLDGVCIDPRRGNHARFRRVKAPACEELTKLTHTIAHRIGLMTILRIICSVTPLPTALPPKPMIVPS